MSQDKVTLLHEILDLLDDEARYTAGDATLEQARLDGIAYYRREFERLRAEHEIRDAWANGHKVHAVASVAAAVVRHPRASAARLAYWLRARKARGAAVRTRSGPAGDDSGNWYSFTQRSVSTRDGRA